MKVIFALSAAALALTGTAGAAPVGGGKLSAAGAAKPMLVVPTASDINNPYFLVGAGTFSGVGGLITNAFSLRPFVGLCTGAFINPQVVLTAAHCIDNNPTRIRFRTGSGTIDPGFVQYEGSHYWIHPNYDPARFYEGWDIAAVVLTEPVKNGEDVYETYKMPFDERFELHTKVGFGTTGEGATGGTLFDIKKRAGENTWDFFGNEIFSDINENGLVGDFDNGNPANDSLAPIWAFYGFPGFSDTGAFFSPSLGVYAFADANGDLPATASDWVLVESSSAPGDSGGPTFIGNQIAGITSWGINDPWFDCPTGYDVSCNRSSWGDWFGDTRVSAFIDEMLLLENFSNVRKINKSGIVRFVGVPTPSAVALFGLGLLGLAATRRSRG